MVCSKFKGLCPLGTPYQACDPKTHWAPFGPWSDGKEKEELKSKEFVPAPSNEWPMSFGITRLLRGPLQVS